MTTFVNFTPAVTAPFQFNAALDGAQYTVILTWNLFGQRYYVNLYTLSGTLVVALALVGSPLDKDIDLVEGYFTTSTLIYREANRQFEISP